MKVLGIDTIEFGIDINNYDENFSELLEKLEELKIMSQENLKEEVFKLNGINFLVKRKGQGFYRYKIECDDFYVCFMQNDMKNNSPIYVRFMSAFLWKYGYELSYKLFLKWFSEFRVEILGNRISRLDICFDTDEIQFFSKDKKKFVTRARKIDIHYVENQNEKQMEIDSEHYIGKIFTGFVIGRGSPLSCRIYNKTIEVKKSKNWFYEIWKKYNWKEENTVWRIEFQARRKVLKELSVCSYEDISNKLKEIWAYYTQKWLVLKDRIDKNVTRCSISKKWILIQSGGENYTSSPAIRKAIKKGDLETLLCQCSGLFISIASICNTSINDTYLTIARAIREKNAKNNTSFDKEVEKRKHRYL